MAAPRWICCALGSSVRREIGGQSAPRVSKSFFQTESHERLVENIKAAEVSVSAADIKDIEDTIATHPIEGQRNDERALATVDH
jgi:hypothetical protein